MSNTPSDNKLTIMDRTFSDEENQIILSLTQTYYFNRLHEISFLGIIDYLNRHSLRKRNYQFTRADHTFGVLELARRFITGTNLSRSDRKIIICTAICHDLGHSAFSHSTEKAFRTVNPSLSHKEFTKSIINNSDSDVNRILVKHNIDLYRLHNLCNGVNNDPFMWLFHGPINIDTIDGMFRFLLSFLLPSPFDPDHLTDSIIRLYNNIPIDETEVSAIDRFWAIKGGFYENFLVTGVYADYERDFVQSVIRHFPTADERDFFLDEKEIAKILSLGSLPKAYARERRTSTPVAKSTFRIQPGVIVQNLGDLEKRYVRKRNEDQ